MRFATIALVLTAISGVLGAPVFAAGLVQIQPNRALNYDEAVAAYCAADNEKRADLAYRIAWSLIRARERDKAAPWLRHAAKLGYELPEPLREELASGRQTSTPAVCGGGATARPRPAGPAPAAIAQIARRIAPQYKLDANLVLAVIAVESAFQSNAVSPKEARGLMQLIAGTAERFDVDDVFDPADNIRGGARYLAWLLKTFDGDLSLALAGYNAGENAVRRHGGIPPYPETQEYVRAVQQEYARLKEAPTPTAPTRTPPRR